MIDGAVSSAYGQDVTANPLLSVIKAVTGRSVTVSDGVTSRRFISYVSQQAAAVVRGCVAQLFRAMRPKLLFISAGAKIRGLELLNFGPRLRLGERSQIICWSRGGIKVGADFSLGENSVLSNGFNPFSDIGFIDIGSNVGIGGHSYISCPSCLTIGDNTITGQYLSIHAQNHIYEDGTTPIRLQGTTAKGVVIGADCWIGAKVTILDGVSVGDGSIIAAGAVVTQTFAPKSIIGGVPAKLIGNR